MGDLTSFSVLFGTFGTGVARCALKTCIYRYSSQPWALNAFKDSDRNHPEILLAPIVVVKELSS